jgi:hypothetical protein
MEVVISKVQSFAPNGIERREGDFYDTRVYESRTVRIFLLTKSFEGFPTACPMSRAKLDTHVDFSNGDTRLTFRKKMRTNEDVAYSTAV